MRARIVDDMCATPQDVLVATFASISDWSGEQIADRVRAPVLLITAGDGIPADLARTRELLPGAGARSDGRGRPLRPRRIARAGQRHDRPVSRRFAQYGGLRMLALIGGCSARISGGGIHNVAQAVAAPTTNSARTKIVAGCAMLASRTAGQSARS